MAPKLNRKKAESKDTKNPLGTGPAIKKDNKKPLKTAAVVATNTDKPADTGSNATLLHIFPETLSTNNNGNNNGNLLFQRPLSTFVRQERIPDFSSLLKKS